MKEYDIVVIGGGIAGMTSALMALREGISNILIIERESTLGGILNQCISNKYGKKVLGADFTGPEYVSIIEGEINNSNIEVKLNTEVLSIDDSREVTYVNPTEGVIRVKSKAIIVATGCREKLTGSVGVPLNRFTGIYTVGHAQKVIVLEGYLPGKNPVVLANCNWALSVARRLVIEGAEVNAVIVNSDNGFEINDYYREIFEDLNINVLTKCKVEEIFGDRRVEGIKVYSEEIDKTYSIACDSLIFSVGYLPEISVLKNTNVELCKDTLVPNLNDYQTSIPGIFACGNVIYGIDALNQEDIDGIEAGKKVAEYLKRNHV